MKALVDSEVTGGVAGRLRQLLDASERLRSALLRRDTEGILKATADQQDAAAESLRRSGEGRGDPDTLSDGGADGPEVIRLVERIKRTQRTNKALAGAFIKTVDRTLACLNTGVNHASSGTYNATGSVGSYSLPVLIRQEG